MSDASENRKQRTAEETPRESEEQLRLLLENMEDMVCRHLPDSTVMYVSPSCQSLTGYTPQELVHTRAADYLHPDDVRATLAAMGDAVERHDGHYRVQHRMKRKGGGYVWVETAGRLLYGTGGHLREIQCVVRNITVRKRVEEELLAWKKRYESAVESSGHVLYDWDSATNQVTYGGAIEDVLGYSAHEMSGDLSRWVELIHPDDRELFTETIEHLIATKESIQFEYRVRRKDGAYILIEDAGQFIKESHGKVTQMIGFVKDITDRKRAEEALLSEKLLSEEYINSLPGLFYVFDEQRFVRWNKEWEKITGYNSRELGAKYGTDFFEGQDRALIEESMLNVFREGAAEAEAELVTKDGRRIPYYFTGLRKVFNGKDHLVGLGIDVTDRKRAQREREDLIAKLEAQNAELERFTYTVSHDLKSPLITIKGYVGMLRQDLPEADSGPVGDDLSRISDAADKMDQLLRNLLELSRIGRSVNPSVDVSLEELADQARELVHGQTEEAGVQVEISANLPVVFGDRIRLLEVLQNLIDNAVKYMGEQSRPRIEIGSRSDGNQTVCYVRDNGMGIKPRYHEKIFGLFDQLDQNVDGTGIGLALARRIVEIHGGRIWVESEGPGHGSTFCFTLATKAESPESG